MRQHMASVARLACFGCALIAASFAAGQPLGRHAIVTRHDVHFDRFTPRAPLQVGNGEFAFAFDITGLQTFESDDPGSPPPGTMAQWSWHQFPGSRQAIDRYADTLIEYDVHGRMVSYATDMQSDTANTIRANPHRFNLARIALRLTFPDGRQARPDNLADIHQVLHLWTGEAITEFEFAGQPATVRTVAHPELDAVAFSIESPLVASGQLAIEVGFSYPAGVWGPVVDDWHAADRHRTRLEPITGGARFVRTLDDTKYAVHVWTAGSVSDIAKPHHYEIAARDGKKLEAVFCFTQDTTESPAGMPFDQVQQAAAKHWEQFWSTGGAIDLAGSTDPRWRELERRIVLSQYLTAIQCAGSMPPQETGLLCNSWFGKSHLEMHWWHAAHFAQWGRFELLERSLAWYEQILPAARAIATRQGYAGARWPKMTGPRGISSPSEVGELLIWQQPHPIYFAELAYRHRPDRSTLEKYQRLVEETADFMADYACLDKSANRYTLGPVLIPAQECYDGRSVPGVLDPTFELTYWRWALQVAGEWRERLGLPRNAKWDDVATRIARPTVRDGVYTAIEIAPFTRRQDHPSMLAALGVLPNVGIVDRGTMRRTLADVQRDWDWPSTWGWDYPMMAMTAARLGERATAIDCLLFDSPKNTYLANGHCWQADRLPAYLPANGGLLSAAAMMAAGWDGSDALGDAPGFPNDGTWHVRHEGLQPMP